MNIFLYVSIKVSRSGPFPQDAESFIVHLHERHDRTRLHDVPLCDSEQERLLQLAIGKHNPDLDFKI